MKPYLKSQPIPEVNNEPVKVVVAETLEDMVFNSGKDGSYQLMHHSLNNKCKNSYISNLVILFYLDWARRLRKKERLLQLVV